MDYTQGEVMSNYKRTKVEGVFQNVKTGKFQARIQIGDKHYKQSFDSSYKARVWRNSFNGEVFTVNPKSNSHTLGEVWERMREKHFPTLEMSTRTIWERRYTLLETLQFEPMSEITEDVISDWVSNNVKYFKSDVYLNGPRGLAKRCNLDNELNLFSTIFNWYKKSSDFKAEAVNLSNPVTRAHYKMGFIQAKPVKDKSITLEAAMQFFSCLKHLYKNLALFQFYTASRVSEAAGLQWKRIDLDNRTGVIMETCVWDNTHKTFIMLKEYPKNREPRHFYINDELMRVLKEMRKFKREDSDYVFHVDGRPLNYCTIQMNYRDAQRIAGIPFRGTHILRHGMAKLARQVGGGLDAVVAMTGHKDYKLADHYSKLSAEYQREVSEKISRHINEFRMGGENVLKLDEIRRAGN
jgi:integrase